MSKTKIYENKNNSNNYTTQKNMSINQILLNFLPNDLINEVKKYLYHSHKQVMNQLINKVKSEEKEYKVWGGNLTCPPIVFDFKINGVYEIKRRKETNSKHYITDLKQIIFGLEYYKKGKNNKKQREFFNNWLNEECNNNGIKYNEKTTNKKKIQILLSL